MDNALDLLRVAPAERGSAPSISEPIDLRMGSYRALLATTNEQREAIYRLRFLVFNLELNEGLQGAYADGRDVDEFDNVCDHIFVQHVPSRAVVGTYRVQTGTRAAASSGYYSAREFDFTPYDHLLGQLLELGRACIHKDHRSYEVLTLLWKAVGSYAMLEGARYLIGCSSLTSQSIEEGSTMFHSLSDYLVDPSLRTRPIGEYVFPIDGDSGIKARPPKLLRAYLSIGAQICGEPAIDREFKTIDFLTLLDIHKLSLSARARFFGF